MGDRGNIVIESADKTPRMYFYTHWSGSDLPTIVAGALVKGRSRWDDASYLNRVLFQAMLGKDDDVTGFGIDTEMGDGGTEVYVCHEPKRVRFQHKEYTFEEFAMAGATLALDEDA